MRTVDFTTVREDWSVVELGDGTLIRMRPTLLWVPQEGGEYGIRLALQMAVWAKKKGTPSKQAITHGMAQKNLVTENIAFKYLTRGESRYKIRGEQLKLVIVPERFDKSSLVDKDGEPVYDVRTEVQIMQEVPKPKRRKSRKRTRRKGKKTKRSKS